MSYRAPMSTQSEHRFGVTPVTLAALTIARTAVNVSRRFTYLFVPALARALGVSVGAVQGAVALQGATGMASPLFGPSIERWGRRRTMIGCLMVMSAAGLIGSALGGFAAFTVVLAVWGLGKMVHDPALLAWVGDRVPYARRAAAMGVTELSWALSLLVSAPVVGWLLGHGDVRLVMLAVGGGLAGGALLVIRFVPATSVAAERVVRVVSPWAAWLALSVPARTAVLYSFLIVVANEVFLIDLGVWLERTHGLGLAGLGLAALVIGGAEVLGEFLVIGLADRFGKRRMVLWGTLLSATMYVMVPLFGGGSPVVALGFVFAAFLGVEVAFVASFPLITSLAPGSRAVLLSANAGAHAAGRLSGAALGGVLLAVTGEFLPVTVTCFAFGAVAAVVLARQIKEDRDDGVPV